jgi:ribosomal protein L11 methyltransferase
VSTHSLIEISLSGLGDETARLVVNLFDQRGRGGAVIEQIFGEDAGSTVKTYLLSEDDDSLRQIEIGLELLNQASNVFPCEGQAPAGRLPEPRIRFLADADWAEAWKTSYDVLRVGHRLVIKPTWRNYTPQTDDLIITLDPGMAFGSGLHPTTRLCLGVIEDHLIPGATVLDVGTGSGILAIAAAQLGASRVLALDTDPMAVQVARENVALNHVEPVVHVEVGTVQSSNTKYQIPNAKSANTCPTATFPHSGDLRASRLAASTVQQTDEFRNWDLVVANILAETIVALAPALAASLALGGILVVSGIIADRTGTVIASLRENRLSLLERRDDGDWAALVARKDRPQNSNQ